MRDFDEVTCALNSREAAPPSLEGGVGDGGKGNETRLVVPVSAARPHEFLCRYETHCFALCMCCDFFACDCRMKCSDGCDCFHDQTWSANVIQCGRRGHSEVPEFIPMDATAIYLDGNSGLGDLSSETFIGRKHLRELYLNASGVTAISNRTLDGLEELSVLHLQGNRLSSLTGGEFAGLRSLLELRLDRNRLSFVHPSTFEPLRRLRVLDLSHNRLAAFPAWQLLSNAELSSASLAGNPWSCECGFLRELQRFLRQRRDAVTDADELRCSADGGDGGAAVAVASAIGDASCADVMAVSFKSDGEGGEGGDGDSALAASSSSSDGESGEDTSSSSGAWPGLIPVLAVVASAVVIVGSLIVLAVAFRRPVSNW